MYEYKKGDKEICKCGHQITYTGKYWLHDGQLKLRHPGFPAVIVPVILENFADNGAHSHWSVINSVTGKIIIRNIMDMQPASEIPSKSVPPPEPEAPRNEDIKEYSVDKKKEDIC